MTSVGFTGTRKGMTLTQWEAVERLMYRELAYGGEFHDGDCIGADEQAHATAVQIRAHLARTGGPPLRLHGHPCNLDAQRAYMDYDDVWDVDAPLARNRAIVASADLMIAAPSGYDEIIRGSGTWGTIRHARLKNRPLVIVWPDGTTTEENR